MKLSVKECVSFAWKTFKARPWFFVATTIIVVVIEMLGGSLQEGAPILGSLVSIAVSTLVYCGIITLYLKAHDNVASVSYKDLWNPKPFWSYLGVSILTAIVVILGLIVLIIPGIILGIMFSFSGYFVVEKGMTPIAAMKESMKLTRGNRWKLFLLGLTFFFLGLLGAIPVLLGLLVVVPMGMLATVHAYRNLQKGMGTIASPEAV
jgi:uncharacterized membrane protein